MGDVAVEMDGITPYGQVTVSGPRRAVQMVMASEPRSKWGALREADSPLRNDEEGPGPEARRRAEERAAALGMAAAARQAEARESSPDSTSTLCNGEGEAVLVRGECVCDGLFGIHDSGCPATRATFVTPTTLPPPEFIQSEREHPAPPSPAFDPHAAAEVCSHTGCRRRAFASLSNIDGDHWLACAEHYEQDLASQARADGPEPAWRVPIAPGVTLERWRGGPIGVKVDGELRCYVTAGELARIFEGPVD